MCSRLSEHCLPISILIFFTPFFSQAWNILGDAESGYILTEGDDTAQNCLQRDGETAKVGSCDTNYARLSLQFASKEDIALMMSPGARSVFPRSIHVSTCHCQSLDL